MLLDKTMTALTSVRRRTRYGRVAVALAALVALGGACNTANAARSAKTTTTTTRAPGSQCPKGLGGFYEPETKFGTSQSAGPDPTTSVPTERGTRPIDPSNDAGQEVVVAKGGYVLPEWLVAEVTLPITWTNLSAVPQQVVFDDAPICSPVLAPGATFSWKSPGFAVNLTYHIVNGHHGKLTLQNPNPND